MAFELRLTPHGIVTPIAVADIPAETKRLRERFAEDEAAGLVALAAGGLPPGAARSVVFWHDVAAEFLRALCHVQEGGDLGEIADPDAARLAEWVLSAPPMSGGEYLGPEMLRELWQRLAAWTAARVSEAGGLAGFLELGTGRARDSPPGGK